MIRPSSQKVDDLYVSRLSARDRPLRLHGRRRGSTVTHLKKMCVVIDGLTRYLRLSRTRLSSSRGRHRCAGGGALCLSWNRIFVRCDLRAQNVPPDDGYLWMTTTRSYAANKRRQHVNRPSCGDAAAGRGAEALTTSMRPIASQLFAAPPAGRQSAPAPTAW